MTSQSTPAATDILPTPTNPDGPLTLGVLEAQVASVEITTPLDRVLEVRSNLAFVMEQAKLLKSKLDDALFQWVEANGEITIGSKRIFIGKKKDTKVVDLRLAVEALLNSCSGDFDDFCKCLSSGALKYGACKSYMGEEVWAQHFVIEEKKQLNEKGEEQPVKELVEIDENFLRTKRR